MIAVRLSAPTDTIEAPVGVLVCPVVSAPEGGSVSSPPEFADEVAAFHAEVEHSGKPGQVESLPRPLREPSRIILVGVGAGDESGWRKAGGAVARSVRHTHAAIHVPADLADEALRGLAEGIWLGAYSFRFREEKPSETIKLTDATVLIAATPRRQAAVDAARIVATSVNFARDLTNTPSSVKNPAWFVQQVREQAGPEVTMTVREPAQLADEGFGGILAVGGGSAHGPRMLELSWQPEGASEHIVLVGKGITFDTGGVDIKPVEGMQLMRKDMGGAATVVAATLAAARLGLKVRVTALAPLAENMLSGNSWRSSDVVHHYGGLTSEIRNTDAEGRVVLADALAYAAARLQPTLLLDFATLTGASRIALGKTTAALFSDNDDLVEALRDAAAEAGESVWRMPLSDEYAKDVVAELADLDNAAGNPGAITAALYLREFAGTRRGQWAHVDMSAPSWSAESDGDVRKGATGWGVRTLVRWLGKRSG